MKKFNWGPYLIMLAASLWALDGLIRTALTFKLPSATIVLLEHSVGAILLLPFLIKGSKELRALKLKDWSILLALTIVSSVLGTILFTQALAKSFAYFDFASPILVQKLQPVFVVLLAGIFLREKISKRFFILMPVALLGSYLISFGAEIVKFDVLGKTEVYLLALGAALAWGSGTIFSKKVLAKLSFSTSTAIRFWLAIPISFIAMLILGQTIPAGSLDADVIMRFIIIAFTTGAGAILIYYKGLQTTKANIATFCELTFPVITILIAITPLNPYGAAQVLSPANIIGIILLLGAIILISIENKSNES